MNDVGLLRRMTNLDSRIVVEGNKLFEEFKGALTENYVLNMLNIVFDNVQNKNKIIPIEVKSGKSVNNTSLTRYNDKFDDEIAVRFSLNNLKLDGKILHIPLYFIEYMYKFT